MKRRIWTKEELIVTFNLYLKIPFGKMHRGNPDVIRLAKLIGRTPSSVAMRLTNYAHIDPYHQNRGIKGLEGGAKQCQPIWKEFINNREELYFESEKILARYEKQEIGTKFREVLTDIGKYKGESKIREIKTRINQNVFRTIILSNYHNRCAISGININNFLIASHIIPWSVNEKERLNPENGICLSSLYDLAFDKGYIGIDHNYKLLLSNRLKEYKKEKYYNSFFRRFEGEKISIPDRFKPKKEFIEYHLENIFN